MCVFWALQLSAGQVLAAVHDIHNDKACGKFTTATFLGKKCAVLCASCFWTLQSAWIAFAMDGRSPPLSCSYLIKQARWRANSTNFLNEGGQTAKIIGVVHAAAGIGMASGTLHIKYAYPFGFLTDIYVLAAFVFPAELAAARVLMLGALAINVISGLPSPSLLLAKALQKQAR